MNHTACTIGLFLFFVGQINSQPTIITNQTYDFLSIDAYGLVYTIRGTELTKFDASGNLKQRYSNNKMGNIAHVDVSNPLKLLLFYRESNAVLFLDHELTEITGALDIYQMANFEASLACASSDGGFWLWNPVQQTVNHFNDQRISDRQTQCLSDWLLNNTVTEILESEQKLFLVASSKILIFDYFGTYLTSLALEQVRNLNFSNQKLIWYNGTKMMTYHWTSHQSEEISIPEGKTPKQAFVVGKKMVLGLETGIEIYDLK